MNKEYMRNIINKAVQQFAFEWQIEPYKWLYEIDIQCDLAKRIEALLPETMRTITAQHTHDKKENRLFSRVTCQPYVKINKKVRAIHPDIVIWRDPQNNVFINEGYFPIFWACEIKSSFSPNVDFYEDEQRMKALLKERAQLTSQLIFVQDKSGAGGTIAQWTGGDFFRWIIKSVT